ncbi:hypothetical protein Ddye_001923 [Dipteronia dyeriana]|uniref:Endonuclease/exonuclease/phosphatase n=1 Tax=Dipteronia dyeriana TaxID=168575 RepID=A0AAD9XPJ5_9ROSI|nr:hypothetical protein Ddye_001923 [Dipteronia dyeriana]
MGLIPIPLSGVPSQSLGVGVSGASSGLTIQNDKLLSDSQVELRFIADFSLAKPMEAEDLDSDGLAQRTMMVKHRLESYKSEFQTTSSSSHDSILYWNCHGIGNNSSKRVLKDLCCSHRPSLVCILEPIVAFDSISARFWSSIGLHLVVLGAHECLGSRSPTMGSCEDFKSMIEDCNLIGIRSQGARFTWVRGCSSRTRVEWRLDRTLVSEGYITRWGDISCVALPRRFSDHCPFWIRLAESHISTSRPFHFQSMWVDHPEFMNLVRKRCWEIMGRDVILAVQDFFHS